MAICPLDPPILPHPPVTSPQVAGTSLPIPVREAPEGWAALLAPSVPLSGTLGFITLFLHVSECEKVVDALEGPTCLEIPCSFFSVVLPLPQTLPRRQVASALCSHTHSPIWGSSIPHPQTQPGFGTAEYNVPSQRLASFELTFLHGLSPLSPTSQNLRK